MVVKIIPIIDNDRVHLPVIHGMFSVVVRQKLMTNCMLKVPASCVVGLSLGKFMNPSSKPKT
jgi:hypothetical protein